MMKTLGSAALVLSLGVALSSQRAEACGCFAPPDPTVPIVQAGERILFAVNNGVVTAHIQIQYAGDAKDFGWLLPLPAVPQLKLGTEELFTQLINSTQPRYFVTRTFGDGCNSRFAFASPPSANSADTAGGGSEGGAGSPLVTQSSIGPYDYAVLRADSKDEMFNWLTSNRYFIPTGTDQTVGPYIRPGAYFLALKLKSGKSAGDIQPVVLEYQSDLPMIPIILTSVAANPNMGVQVWMLGSARAIPRNYNHVVLNDSQIDWLNQAANYNDVVIKAVSEAPEKHAFITEYSGSSDVMIDRLDYQGRFGNLTTLAGLSDPVDFVEYLFANGYAQNTGTPFGPVQQVLLPQVKNLVAQALPMPEPLKSVTDEDSFYLALRYYLTTYRQSHPEAFKLWDPPFDAAALAAQLDEAVVKPTLNAGAIFRAHPTLTRLYTTLSPQDMTRDPVFSFNPSLAPVSRDHTATLHTECTPFGTFTTFTTEQGWVTHSSQFEPTGPGALRIETLSEEGPAKILTDNTSVIDPGRSGCGGCASVEPMGLGLVAALLALRRRRMS
ncbi:MAG: DUF2330 domain-containing protein [Myxococcota bacterium]